MHSAASDFMKELAPKCPDAKSNIESAISPISMNAHIRHFREWT